MISYVNKYFLGPLLPIILISAGTFLAFKYKFLIFTRIGRICKTLFKRKQDLSSPFTAACIALAGTLGVGNIAGVAAAISSGGPGAVFWMWISSLFALVLKYAETVSAMAYKKDGRGGASYYIEKGMKSRALGVLFSALVIFSSFSVGNVVQSSAAAEALAGSFGVPKIVTGLVFAVITIYLLSNKGQRVNSFSSTLIPILSLGYIVISLAIILKNCHLIPQILSLIVRSAMNFRSLGGGVFGFFMSRSVRYGIARGLLSNEAGCGTATYAHASVDNDPVEQGFWGIFEVVFDTVILCTLTALVVLIANPLGVVGENGMRIAISSYELVGKWGGSFVASSSALYALASVVCWSYYGCKCLEYMGAKDKSRRMYLLLYGAAGVLGSLFSPKFVWEISDFSISLLAIINIICLCRISKKSVLLTKNYFSAPSKRGAPSSFSESSDISLGSESV